MSIKIIGTGSAIPGHHLTNDDLAGMVETSDEWIRERTGIGGRSVSKGETVVSLATAACERALENAGKMAEEMELLLVATCTPEDALPCVGCQVQANIGAKNAVAFDLNAACAGFLFALHTAWAYIEAGIYKNAMVVGSEVLSKIIDWNDRGTCVLFGDAAGAVVVEKCEEGGILGFVQHANGERGHVLSCVGRPISTPFYQQETESQYVQMDGREVFAFALRQVPAAINEVLDKVHLKPSDIDMYVLHQANKRIIEGISKKLDFDITGEDGKRFPMNLNRVGNTSSAAIPLLLDELNRAGKVKSGMKLMLSGFGAGLTYGACVMEW